MARNSVADSRKAYPRPGRARLCCRSLRDNFAEDDNRSSLRFEDPLAAYHGALDCDLVQVHWVRLERVFGEDDEIGELAGFERSFGVFFKGRVGTVDCSASDGFF